MHISNFIGWDIGGAHLKVANINSDGKIVAAGDPKIHKQLLKIIQKVK